MSTTTSTTRREPLFLHASGPGFTVLGQVTKLGPRRVTYEFVDCGEKHPREVVVHLFSSSDGHHLTALPCVLIDEHLTEPGCPLTTLMMKRSELEFQQLTVEQEKLLWDFLKNDYLQRVQEAAIRRQVAPKPQVSRNAERIKPRSFFSLMHQDEQAV